MADSVEKPQGWRGFVKRNRFYLVFVPLLVSIHWGWYTLQHNPRLVNPTERKDPLEIGIRYVKGKWEQFAKSDKQDP